MTAQRISHQGREAHERYNSSSPHAKFLSTRQKNFRAGRLHELVTTGKPN
jgi:hypothetical protein